MSFDVEYRNVHGQACSIGSAGPYTLVVDRPADGGAQGLGFNGGQLLYLAVGGCISNDLFREADARGIALTRVHIRVEGDFAGEPMMSEEISYDVELAGNASDEALNQLIAHVDAIAEIPNSLRRGTSVRLRTVNIAS